MKNRITIGLFTLCVAACMDPRPNYDECVQIETARCDVRSSCQENGELDDSYKDFDVATCIAYGREHCRTRKIIGEDWDQADVEKCVEAILSLDNNCDTLAPRGVDETESIGQCNFIENGDAGLIDLSPDETDTDGDDAGDDTDEDENTSENDAGA